VSTVMIPCAEIHAIAKRHGVDYDLDSDPTAEWVRGTAKYLRSGSAPAATVLAEAADLDALVDRIENQRDDHCIAYSEGSDTGRCVCGHVDEEHDRELGQCEAPLNVEATA